MRTALGLIEGVNGQYIGALLGYQFERELHEAADNVWPVPSSTASSLNAAGFRSWMTAG